jgi:hypothetical protein
MSNPTAATTLPATSRYALNTNRYHPGNNNNNAQTVSTTSMIAPDGTMLLSEEEIEKIMDNFAQEDTAYNKTWTRIVVETVLSKVRFIFVSVQFPNMFMRVFSSLLTLYNRHRSTVFILRTKEGYVACTIVE